MKLFPPMCLLACVMGIGLTDAAPCSSDLLGSFKETTIAAPVNKCKSASDVNFSMPPTADLTEEQRDQICGERICKEMIAAIDDMDVPRCDLLYNGKNVTLQMSLDRFTSICDAPRSPVPELKKRGAKKTENVASPAAAAGFQLFTLLFSSLAVLVLSVL